MSNKNPLVFVLSVITLICVIWHKANAAEIDAAKIGVVNMETVMTKSVAAKSAVEKITSIRNKSQKDIQDQDKNLKAEEEKIAKEKGTLKESALEKKQEEFRGKVANFHKNIQAKREELEKLNEIAQEQVYKALTKVIAEIAKAKKLTLVVPNVQALYYEESTDITSEVLQKLDSVLKKVDFPESSSK